MIQTNIIIFFLLCGIGIIISAFASEQKNPFILSIIGSIASIVILLIGAEVLVTGNTAQFTLWTLPYFGTMAVKIDRLSALFVFVTGLVYLPVSIFSAGYLKRYLSHYSLRVFSIFYYLLFASIVMVLISWNVILFIISWETMSILSYLLVNYEYEHEHTTSAGLLMLSMSEAGTIAVIIGFLIMAGSSGNTDFSSFSLASGGLSTISRWMIFLLTFFGFGVKTGIVPVNTWLPRAHPVAPGNISAILSAIILNLGIYGIVRINTDLVPVTMIVPGLIILIVGTITALVGILYATIENDIKKLLAHSSIENMGIITAGIGAGLVFMASGYPILSGIAFIAAFYHMTNHSLYKSLLFLGASSIDFSIKNRNMDQLGGLIKLMPWTGLFFLAGSLSIAAFPPFNGFVSEWLTIQTMLQVASLPSTGVKIIFALCGAGIALTAALAVTAFVKAFAMSFLGIGRSKEVQEAKEVSRSMTIPMGMLAVSCLLFGIIPTYYIPVLDNVVSPIVHESVVDNLIPPFFTATDTNNELDKAFLSDFHNLGAQVGKGILPGQGLVILHRGTAKNPVVFAMSTSYTFIVLILLLGVTFIVVKVFTRQRAVSKKAVWSGGIRRLIPEMTYTATGFSNPVRVVFNAVLRPETVEDTKEAVEGHFRTAIKNERKEVHITDRWILNPVTRFIKSLSRLLAKMHTGNVNTYAVYIFVSLIMLLFIQLIVFR